MKSRLLLLAAIGAAIGSAAHAADPVLLPILTHDRQLQLFDPTQPRSATNPTKISSNVAYSPFVIPYARLIRSAGVADGLVRPIDFPLLVYTQDGRLYRRDLRLDASHERVRVSGVGHVCRIQGQVLDLEQPVNSWVRVAVSGSDGSCETADDVYRFVRLSMGATEKGALLTANQLFSPILGASGAITGFLTATSDDLASPKLLYRDRNFQNPRELAHLDPQDPLVKTRQFGFSTTFVIAHVAGANARSLYRIDNTGNGPKLSAPLHAFENGEGSLVDAVSDGQHLYFGDRNQLMRLPMNATSAAESSRVLKVAAARIVDYLALTSDESPRIILNARDPVTDDQTIYSMRKDGTGEPVVLAKQVAQEFHHAYLIATSGSHLYIVDDGTLRRVDEDGSNSQNLPFSVTLAIPGRFDPDLTSTRIPQAERFMVSVWNIEASVIDYRLYDAVGEQMGCRLGSLEDRFSISRFETAALGRTIGLFVYDGVGGDNEDTYVVDLKRCGSLQPAAARVDRNENPVWGL